ncbi:hypothetical protein EG329_005134 [Mollisiaceae sp. DMI_Dod_QoI]|nr:hypothetical protein EG329_005134 [Helotiales sp. DMI_Dod_QoI]
MASSHMDSNALHSALQLPTLEEFVTNYPSYAVLLDSTARILLASDSFLRYYGLVSLEVIGANLLEVVTQFNLIPDAESWRTVIDMARATGKIYVTNDIKGEENSLWTLRSNPIINQGILVCMLVSIKESTHDYEMRQSINDQLDGNDSYRVLVEQVKDYAIFMIDPVGNVKTWNAGAQLLKGYTKEEIVGQHFSIFYGDEDKAAGKPQKELAIALRDGRVEDESFRYRKDGTKFIANVIITAMYRNGIHVGFSKVTRDLTERRASEARLIEAYKENDKIKSAFLANMSHEIRTPLNGLMMSLDLLLDTNLNDEARENASDMKQSATLLAETINGVLDYSKLESGGFTISHSVINIRAITTALVRGFRTTVKPGVLLEATFADDLPSSIKGDALRFRQVLQNLVSNAMKFTHAGSVSVHVSVKSSDEHSYMILTEVTDTGIGIADTDVRSLFNRFSQIDTSATKKYQGTGLGLAISKGLAELMGGAVGYHPNPNAKGSVFWFSIQAGKAFITTPPDEPEKQLEVLSLNAQPPLAVSQLRAVAPTKRILLVEDNMVNQKVQLKMLKNLGFISIDLCKNGAEAVQLVKDKRLLYDAILMDISMPIMDGITATVEIRRAGIGIPIIAMTANALKGDVEGYLEKGMNAYVSKPVNKDLLVETLAAWLN